MNIARLLAVVVLGMSTFQAFAANRGPGEIRLLDAVEATSNLNCVADDGQTSQFSSGSRFVVLGFLSDSPNWVSPLGFHSLELLVTPISQEGVVNNSTHCRILASVSKTVMSEYYATYVMYILANLRLPPSPIAEGKTYVKLSDNQTYTVQNSK